MISARACRRLERTSIRSHAARPVLEALVALLVFVGGFEIGPTLHLIAHASLAPHLHEGGHPHSTRTVASAASPDHDAVSRADSRPAHGHDSVAHRGVLFLGAPPPTPLVPVAGVIARLRAERLRIPRERRLVIAHAARGPPRMRGVCTPRRDA